MVKFFLPQANKKQKPRKKTDYRIIIYKQLLQLAKAKHLKYISNIVKQIKQLKQSGKDIGKQEKKLMQYKQIKKRQIKLLTVYVMIQYLNMGSLSVLEKLTNISQSPEEIKQEVEKQQIYKKFVYKLISSNSYKQKVIKIGELRDGISKKKHLAKQKSKQRKTKKLLRRKQQKLKELSIQGQQNNQNGIQQKLIEQSPEEDQIDINKQQDKREDSKSRKQGELTHNNKDGTAILQNRNKPRNDFWDRVNNRNKKQQNTYPLVKAQMQDKSSRKIGRSQFIKKGRNKIKDEKYKRNQKYSSHLKDKKQTQKTVNQQKKIEKPASSMHPSWLAKQQEKKKASITQFQGKRILL